MRLVIAGGDECADSDSLSRSGKGRGALFYASIIRPRTYVGQRIRSLHNPSLEE